MRPGHLLRAATLGICAHTCCAFADDNPYDDPPPLQSTRGIVDCPAPKPRVLTPEQARREAHQRVERGTSCWLAGSCEPGGDYKDDGKINARVAAAIAADPHFAHSSVWVVTLRKFVTLTGCVVDDAQGRAIEAFARSIDGVKLVWLETKVAPSPKR
jgi:hypothetical protein